MVPGLTLVHFPAMGPLDILPPYVAVVALATIALQELLRVSSQRRPSSDEEHGDHMMLLQDQAVLTSQDADIYTDQPSTAIGSPRSVLRRNSNISRPDVPDPSIFNDSPSASDATVSRTFPGINLAS
jgi:hypothetical protein